MGFVTFPGGGGKPPGPPFTTSYPILINQIYLKKTSLKCCKFHQNCKFCSYEWWYLRRKLVSGGICETCGMGIFDNGFSSPMSITCLGWHLPQMLQMLQIFRNMPNLQSIYAKLYSYDTWCHSAILLLWTSQIPHAKFVEKTQQILQIPVEFVVHGLKQNSRNSQNSWRMENGWKSVLKWITFNCRAGNRKCQCDCGYLSLVLRGGVSMFKY